MMHRYARTMFMGVFLLLAGSCCYLLAMEIKRVLGIAGVMAWPAGGVCIFALLLALWLIKKSRERGYVSGRGGLLLVGIPLFALVYCVILSMNTGYIYSLIAYKSAAADDARNLRHAFGTLETRSLSLADADIETFRARSEQLKSNVIQEVRNNLNQGPGPVARAKANELGTYIGASIELPSLPPGGKVTEEFLALCRSVLDEAIGTAVARRKEARDKIPSFTSDAEVVRAREGVDALLEATSRRSEEDTVDEGERARTNAFLIQAFGLYRLRLDAVVQHLTNPPFALKEPLGFQKLANTSLSYDAREVGYLMTPSNWTSEFLSSPRFWISLFLAAVLDICLVVVWFRFLQEQDE